MKIPFWSEHTMYPIGSYDLDKFPFVPAVRQVTVYVCGDGHHHATLAEAELCHTATVRRRWFALCALSYERQDAMADYLIFNDPLGVLACAESIAENKISDIGCTQK